MTASATPRRYGARTRLELVLACSGLIVIDLASIPLRKADLGPVGSVILIAAAFVAIAYAPGLVPVGAGRLRTPISAVGGALSYFLAVATSAAALTAAEIVGASWLPAAGAFAATGIAVVVLLLRRV
ncbi:hypothetical protein [Frondihabitans australicus]|uniref:Uncharacterized protein n=1 Tax=Frondihabitans australicus TaxID=386892 RepID=A0A495IN12_9MICO|nr:hypothetical protein [Frondihabitans australicus]RKR76571.1 hypothetical protein C8E83_3748 [Frondihabitans australicus]